MNNIKIDANSDLSANKRSLKVREVPPILNGIVAWYTAQNVETYSADDGETRISKVYDCAYKTESQNDLIMNDSLYFLSDDFEFPMSLYGPISGPIGNNMSFVASASAGIKGFLYCPDFQRLKGVEYTICAKYQLAGTSINGDTCCLYENTNTARQRNCFLLQRGGYIQYRDHANDEWINTGIVASLSETVISIVVNIEIKMMKLYINGALSYTGVWSCDYFEKELWIGRSATSNGAYLNGRLKTFGVYQKGFSAAEAKFYFDNVS